MYERFYNEVKNLDIGLVINNVGLGQDHTLEELTDKETIDMI